MATTPDLGIPELAQSQANPDVTHNEALQLIQALMKGVISLGDNAPPVSPTNGDAYVLGAAPTGAWAGRANAIAVRVGSAWRFIPGNDDDGAAIAMGARHDGLRVWVQDEQLLYVWSGSPLAWVAMLPPDASQVAYTPGSPGVIAATNVQDALDEVGREKVNNTGDQITGALESHLEASAVIHDGYFYGDSVNGANWRGAHARGTRASPTQLLSGDRMLIFGGSGYHSGGAFHTTSGRMVVEATENFTATAKGARVMFETTANGGTSRTVNFAVQPDGEIRLGSTTPVVFDGNGVQRLVAFTVATLPANQAGRAAYVTDSNATLTAGIGAVVAGGGANVVPVFNDGANWRIG